MMHLILQRLNGPGWVGTHEGPPSSLRRKGENGGKESRWGVGMGEEERAYDQDVKYYINKYPQDTLAKKK